MPNNIIISIILSLLCDTHFLYLCICMLVWVCKSCRICVHVLAQARFPLFISLSRHPPFATFLSFSHFPLPLSLLLTYKIEIYSLPWQFIEINCICVFDVCLRSTKLIESTFAEHWGDIGLKLNWLSTIFSCYFCLRLLCFCIHSNPNFIEMYVCLAMYIFVALFRFHFYQNLCLHLNTHKLHLHVHIKLHDFEIVVCVSVWLCVDIFGVCLYIYKCVQIRTSFEYETDSDIVAWTNIRYVILHNLFEHCFVITHRYMYILNHTLHTCIANIAQNTNIYTFYML